MVGEEPPEKATKFGSLLETFHNFFAFRFSLFRLLGATPILRPETRFLTLLRLR